MPLQICIKVHSKKAAHLMSHQLRLLLRTSGKQRDKNVNQASRLKGEAEGRDQGLSQSWSSQFLILTNITGNGSAFSQPKPSRIFCLSTSHSLLLSFLPFSVPLLPFFLPFFPHFHFLFLFLPFVFSFLLVPPCLLSRDGNL